MSCFGKFWANLFYEILNFNPLLEEYLEENIAFFISENLFTFKTANGQIWPFYLFGPGNPGQMKQVFSFIMFLRWVIWHWFILFEWSISFWDYRETSCPTTKTYCAQQTTKNDIILPKEQNILSLIFCD